jgi:hypothetical protein
MPTLTQHSDEFRVCMMLARRKGGYSILEAPLALTRLNAKERGGSSTSFFSCRLTGAKLSSVLVFWLSLVELGASGVVSLVHLTRSNKLFELVEDGVVQYSSSR